MSPEGAPAADLAVSAEGRVAVFTLNRPRFLNALTAPLLAALADAFDRAGADDGVGAIVLAGAGSAFSAGFDAAAHEPYLRADAAARDRGVAEGQRVVLAMRRLPKPIVAAIGGVAVGAGLELALAADYRIAGPHAQLSLGQVHQALTADLGGLWFLRRLAGEARAFELAVTGKRLTAQGALERGLVHEVVAQEELAARARKLASDWAGGAALAVRAAKRALAADALPELERHLEAVRALQGELLASADFAAARRAAAERRAPTFQGR